MLKNGKVVDDHGRRRSSEENLKSKWILSTVAFSNIRIICLLEEKFFVSFSANSETDSVLRCDSIIPILPFLVTQYNNHLGSNLHFTMIMSEINSISNLF